MPRLRIQLLSAQPQWSLSDAFSFHGVLHRVSLQESARRVRAFSCVCGVPHRVCPLCGYALCFFLQAPLHLSAVWTASSVRTACASSCAASPSRVFSRGYVLPQVLQQVLRLLSLRIPARVLQKDHLQILPKFPHQMLRQFLLRPLIFLRLFLLRPPLFLRLFLRLFLPRLPPQYLPQFPRYLRPRPLLYPQQFPRFLRFLPLLSPRAFPRSRRVQPSHLFP